MWVFFSENKDEQLTRIYWVHNYGMVKVERLGIYISATVILITMLVLKRGSLDQIGRMSREISKETPSFLCHITRLDDTRIPRVLLTLIP